MVTFARDYDNNELTPRGQHAKITSREHTDNTQKASRANAGNIRKIVTIHSAPRGNPEKRTPRELPESTHRTPREHPQKTQRRPREHLEEEDTQRTHKQTQ